MKRKVLVMLVVSLMLACLLQVAGAKDKSAAVFDKVEPGVVLLENTLTDYPIQTADQGYTVSTSASGTGFFINDHLIVTNHHVVSRDYIGFQRIYNSFSSATERTNFYNANYEALWTAKADGTYITVYYDISSNDMVTGMVVADWPELDLAVIEIDAKNFKGKALRLSDGAHVEIGMDLFVIGYPGVFDSDILTLTTPGITSGILSKVNSTNELPGSQVYKQLVFDATVNHGNSGGPIVDSKGRVIGVVTSMSTQGTAYYGVHIDELLAKLNASGYRYNTGFQMDSKYLLIGVGVLALGVIAALIVMLTRKPKVVESTPESREQFAEQTTMAVKENRASAQGFSGQFKGMKFDLTEGRDCVFGKDPDCTVMFDDHEQTVSHKHCRIHYSQSNRRFIIQDLGSTNGTTLVRGSQKRLVPTQSGLALKDGDMIYIPDKRNSFRVNL